MTIIKVACVLLTFLIYNQFIVCALPQSASRNDISNDEFKYTSRGGYNNTCTSDKDCDDGKYMVCGEHGRCRCHDEYYLTDDKCSVFVNGHFPWISSILILLMIAIFGFVIYYTARIILNKDTCVNAAISRCRSNEDSQLNYFQQTSDATERVNHTLAVIHFTGLPAPRSLTVTTKENYLPS